MTPRPRRSGGRLGQDIGWNDTPSDDGECSSACRRGVNRAPPVTSPLQPAAGVRMVPPSRILTTVRFMTERAAVAPGATTSSGFIAAGAPASTYLVLIWAVFAGALQAIPQPGRGLGAQVLTGLAGL